MKTPKINVGNWEKTKILEAIEEIQHTIENNLQKSCMNNLTYEIRNINNQIKVKFEFYLDVEINQNKCTFCLQQNHNIQHCRDFLSSNEKSRTLIAERLKLCYKCLIRHRKNECKSNNCPNCKGPHNILLCYKQQPVSLK